VQACLLEQCPFAAIDGATVAARASLLQGAVLFGVGWGIAGFCPGPAITALSTGRVDVLFFVGAMVGGAVLHRVIFSSGAVSEALKSNVTRSAAE